MPIKSQALTGRSQSLLQIVLLTESGCRLKRKVEGTSDEGAGRPMRQMQGTTAFTTRDLLENRVLKVRRLTARLATVVLLFIGLRVAAISAEAQALTTLYTFCSSDTTCLDGATPRAGLVQGRDGYFYGTTYRGGSAYSDAFPTPVPSHTPHTPSGVRCSRLALPAR